MVFIASGDLQNNSNYTIMCINSYQKFSNPSLRYNIDIHFGHHSIGVTAYDGGRRLPMAIPGWIRRNPFPWVVTPVETFKPVRGPKYFGPMVQNVTLKATNPQIPLKDLRVGQNISTPSVP
jgi:hypothetical protein